ncbi:hypothetical protein KVP10_08320 [Candidimonas humi]|uniref:Phage protein n=1 Tax=Candidimonas humi TaxID=683355 RepID=A0ABV8NWR9_9BURK|nr:hypothetical protein [Candidimonas humi]MBV6304890.1 hypothetical protein [Candidimonas humi]
MTTKTDITLPPLPVGITEHGIVGHDGSVYADVEMECYARAAVELDRQQRDTHLDYKELYEQMCERCDVLDKALAEYEQRGEAVAYMSEDGRVVKAKTRNTAMPAVSQQLFSIPLYRYPQPTEPAVKQSLTGDEREAFELACQQAKKHFHKVSPCDGSEPYYIDTPTQSAWWAWQARAALESTTQQSLQVAERCPYCDGTGDVHSPDGKWRGICSCSAGVALSTEPVKVPSTAELLSAIQRYADERASMTEVRCTDAADTEQRDAADRTAQAYSDMCALLARYGAQPAANVPSDAELSHLIVRHRLMTEPWPKQSQINAFARDVIARHGAHTGVPACVVKDRGFLIEDGKHVPSLLITFPVNDWDSRDRMAAILSTTTADGQPDAQAIREAALEEAAQQCEGKYQPWGNSADDRAADCMSRSAARIRALKSRTAQQDAARAKEH